MRWIGIAAGLVLAIGALRAADGADDSVPPAVREASLSYARHLQTFLATVRGDYVREVSQARLLEAALSGLYEQARRPLPPTLGEELRKAEKEDRLFAAVYAARAALGNPETLAEDRDLMASLRALPAALDPHCGLVSAEELYAEQGGTDAGLGFELAGFSGPSATMLPTRRPSTAATLRTELRVPFPWRVESVIPGSPAQQAGLRPGDRLTHVNGEPVTAETAAERFAVLRDPPRAGGDAAGQKVTLTVRRPGRDAPLELAVPKGVYEAESVFGVRRKQDNSWDFWLDRGAKIAQVRLGAIDRASPGQMAAALARLEREGMRGLILDLRWCPGGYLNPSIEIAGIFVPEGLIARTTYRNPERGAQEFRAEASAAIPFRAGDYPVVVLVNGETSGGGELIAAALQDHGRGVVVGQRTRGKASVQAPVYFGAATGRLAFKLTQGTFLRPSGKNLQRFPDSTPADDWGVRPGEGHAFTLTPGLSRELKQWWLLQTLRPGGDREALPLDDPRNDPQRQFALGVLQKMLEGGEEQSEERD